MHPLRLPGSTVRACGAGRCANTSRFHRPSLRSVGYMYSNPTAFATPPLVPHRHMRRAVRGGHLRVCACRRARDHATADTPPAHLPRQQKPCSGLRRPCRAAAAGGGRAGRRWPSSSRQARSPASTSWPRRRRGCARATPRCWRSSAGRCGPPHARRLGRAPCTPSRPLNSHGVGWQNLTSVAHKPRGALNKHVWRGDL